MDLEKSRSELRDKVFLRIDEERMMRTVAVPLKNPKNCKVFFNHPSSLHTVIVAQTDQKL